MRNPQQGAFASWLIVAVALGVTVDAMGEDARGGPVPRPLQGPITPVLADGRTMTFVACPGEAGRVGLCWIETEPLAAAQPALESQNHNPEEAWSRRAKRKEVLVLNLAVLTNGGIEWRSSVKTERPWPLSPAVFPGALSYSGELWHLLIRLPDGLCTIGFDSRGSRMRTLLGNEASPAIGSSQFWLFHRGEKWQAFWSRYYWPPHNLPDFMGGRERQRLESLSFDKEGITVPTTVHEVRAAPPAPAMHFQVVHIEGRYDAFYVRDSSPRREADPDCDLFYVRDLLGPRKEGIRIASGYGLFNPLVLVAENEALRVFWLDQRDERPFAARLGEGAVYNELRGLRLSHGAWSKPELIQAAKDWSVGSLAAAAEGANRSILLIGRGRERSSFECLVEREGRWVAGTPTDVATALPGSEAIRVDQTTLVACEDGQYVVVSILDGRLYWLFFTVKEPN